MTKIKGWMFALMGAMLMATSCSDTEFKNGNEDAGTAAPKNSSALVSVYSDKSGSEASLLVGDVLVENTRTLKLNVPAACETVYMKYNTVSGTTAMKEFALSSSLTRSGDESDFLYETNRIASVTLALPEDAVQPTSETDAGYLFYHNTGVVMFEDGWPTDREIWYDEDFNDVVFEYDLKVTECQDEERMAIQGSKEELLLTLDVRAVGGMYPTTLGVVLSDLDSKYVDRITAKLLLKGGQGTMRELKKEELSTADKVIVDVPNWCWNNDTEGPNRFAKLTVDKAQPKGTVITLNGLSSLDNDKDGESKNYFQVTPGHIREGLPMLRAEVRLIGKEGLTGDKRKAQLEAFEKLILDTKRQNFFIVASHDNNDFEIHMRGYEPTSAYEGTYNDLVQKTPSLQGADLYSNERGATWGIKVPVGTCHIYEVKEGKSLKFQEAYPDFYKWLDSKGAAYKDWYLHPDDEKIVKAW